MMTKTFNLLIIAVFFVGTAWAQEQDISSTIAKMRQELDLQQDQVTNITPVIQKYAVEFHDLDQSIQQGTINQSAVQSQRQGIEDAETQELSAYLKPNQLSEWRSMQAELYPSADSGSEGDNEGSDQYSNLPTNPSQQQQ
jgi:hypothetical protein